MITKVSHQVTGRGPADITLALSVSAHLHPQIPAPRAPERVPSPVPEMMGLRVSPARPHRRRVPLKRLNTMRTLSTMGA
ncbi:hypothetical protein NX794_05020 [Streptomyces sp. LP11]|uniref:Uncharacterized protein n=1 Tax=Streptomyces pyxinicus TaxID=2970331 RepID=A0ABT2AWG3_9ACTN|nr:hypothetical protein [Streptomyces sp. LP11]MCS0600595.1 hypothetical protein [Streptomyces sp. LP11]